MDRIRSSMARARADRLPLCSLANQKGRMYRQNMSGKFKKVMSIHNSILLLLSRPGGDNPVNQSKLKVITRSRRHKARENVSPY